MALCVLVRVHVLVTTCASMADLGVHIPRACGIWHACWRACFVRQAEGVLVAEIKAVQLQHP